MVQGHTSAGLEDVIEAWGLMELRLEGTVEIDDTISIELTPALLEAIADHPLAHHLMALPRYGPSVGIEVTTTGPKKGL